MSTTPNMNLNLPTPTSTDGPEWAEQINTAFEQVDAHDHSTGKGVKITPKGLNINSDLSLQGNSLTDAKSVKFNNQTVIISGPTNLNTIYAYNGNLYYNNSSGTAVQITNGGSVSSSADGISRSFEVQSISASAVINSSSTASYISADTSINSISITLPNAGSVAKGRFFYIKDATGNANVNPITLVPNGAQTIDGVASSFTIQTTYGMCLIISDGVSNWQLFRQQVDNADIADNAITTSKIVDGNVTAAKLAANVNSISSASGSFTTTSTSEVSVVNTSITRTGRPVVVMLIEGQVGITSSNTSEASVSIRFKRDSTTLSTSSITTYPGVGITAPASSFSFIDTSAGTGSVTYTAYALVTGTGTASVTNAKIVAYEI